MAIDRVIEHGGRTGFGSGAHRLCGGPGGNDAAGPPHNDAGRVIGEARNQ